MSTFVVYREKVVPRTTYEVVREVVLETDDWVAAEEAALAVRHMRATRLTGEPAIRLST